MVLLIALQKHYEKSNTFKKIDYNSMYDMLKNNSIAFSQYH